MLIHCTPMQVGDVLLSLPGTTSQALQPSPPDVLQTATMVSEQCLEILSQAHSLHGAATKSTRTALRVAPVRGHLSNVTVQNIPLLKALGWIAAAAYAQRHLTTTGSRMQGQARAALWCSLASS